MEPEFVAPDGTTRKTHYGQGKQPWDEILEEGWGAAFAAGNVLKYVRRHAMKNGEDDLRKAAWYYKELRNMAGSLTRDPYSAYIYSRLCNRLTKDELKLLEQLP